MAENKNLTEQVPTQGKKKPSMGWGLNPFMPSMPLHVIMALNQQNKQHPPKQNNKKTLDIYQIDLDARIGSGFSSDVYKAINTQTQTQVCIKVIDYLGLKSPEQKGMIETEIWCLKNLVNPNILKCYDVLESNQFCYIVTQICEGGDLYQLLNQKQSFTEKEVVPIMKQLASALLELKGKDIVHRDIKPSNVLLKQGEVRLCDFGFAARQKTMSEKQKFNLGSPLYMSPEALLENKYGFASDIFSFGVTIYELIHNRTPWQTTNEAELKSRILTQDIHFKEGLSDQFKNLLGKCLQRDLSHRIPIEEVVLNPLLQ